MSKNKFEGSEILETLIELDMKDQFYEAIDSDNFNQIRLILENAGFDTEISNWVIEEIENGITFTKFL